MLKYQVEKTYIFKCSSEIADYVFSTMTITTFRRKIAQKVSVLTKRVRSNCLLQILWTISTIDVASVERRHMSFVEMPMSWFVAYTWVGLTVFLFWFITKHKGVKIFRHLGVS